MTLASIFYGLLIAIIPACLVLFVFGGNLKKLIVIILFSWVGFWLGHLLASWRGWNFITMGPIKLGTALIFSIGFSILGSWLNNIQPMTTKK
ncbi:hypothetical protein SDC9_58997 [bioreactor metagenome]|uniref:Uncharacterized protein n=1 Tax=bioreactor metagenome TaxID=1076179 RepID=A0A644XEN8_9ZZZZ